jgi:hypothetical protein
MSYKILLFINITLYLLVHDLKIRRYAEENVKKAINAVFAGIILLMIFLFFRTEIWNSKFILYIDILLIIGFILIMLKLISRNLISMKNLFGRVFEKKKSILESIFLTILLLTGFIFYAVWFVSFAILMIFLVKEAFLMSDMRTLFKNDDI